MATKEGIAIIMGDLKREKIREGIEKLTEDRFRSPAEGAGLNWDRSFNRLLAEDILSYLHSQGIVIKVDRELPIVPQAAIAPMYDKVFLEGINAGQYNMLKAGYVAVEPLVTEEEQWTGKTG